MRSFAPGFLAGQSVPQAFAASLRLLGEHKGKQDLYKRQAPEVLESLRRSAVVESVQSSTRLEGASAPEQRVLAIVRDGQHPAPDRSEQEIADTVTS